MANVGNFMTLMAATALNNARTTNNIINNTNNMGRTLPKIPKSLLGNPKPIDEHTKPVHESQFYEGEIYYDPFSMKQMRMMQLSDGSWARVPAEAYDACRQGMGYGAYCAVNIPQGSYSSAVGAYSNAYGTPSISNVYTGTTYQGGDYSANFSDRSLPEVEYSEDANIYLKHLYREELKWMGLDGVGVNSFGLAPTADRDDKEICEKVLNKFNNTDMSTKFKQRLELALKRKAELEQRKRDLKASMINKQEAARKKQQEQLNRLKKMSNSRGFQGFIEELQEEGRETNVVKSFEEFYSKPETSASTAPPSQGLSQTLSNMMNANKPILSAEELKANEDKTAIDYFIASNVNWYGVYQHHGEEVDGLKYIDFEFRPSLHEDDPKLDIMVELKGRVVETEERYGDELVDELTDEKKTMPEKFMGNVLAVVSLKKKKTFIKKIRVNYNTLLERAKEN